MNTKNSHSQCIEEDEIDLRELWATLLKRKRLIAIATGVITVLAIAYLLLAKPIYEVKAVISLAKLNDMSVNNPHDLQQKLDYLYVVSEVSLPKESDGIMVVKAQGYTNQGATTKLNQAVDFVIESENKDIKEYINLQKKSILTNIQNIHQLEKTIDIDRKKISTYEKQIISLQKKDAALAAIYAIEVSKKETELNEMQKTRSQFLIDNDALEYSISGVNLKKADRVGEVQVLDYPVKPKKLLIIIVAFITGLMLSVFLAFFLEFIQGAKREHE